MVEPAVVSGVQNYLRQLSKHGLVISFGVIFGSYALGKASQWSDIDLIVVSPNFDHGIDRESVKILWRVAARTDSRIEPIPCGRHQWQEDDSSPIIEIARNEGATVNLT